MTTITDPYATTEAALTAAAAQAVKDLQAQAAAVAGLQAQATANQAALNAANATIAADAAKIAQLTAELPSGQPTAVNSIARIGYCDGGSGPMTHEAVPDVGNGTFDWDSAGENQNAFTMADGTGWGQAVRVKGTTIVAPTWLNTRAGETWLLRGPSLAQGVWSKVQDAETFSPSDSAHYLDATFGQPTGTPGMTVRTEPDGSTSFLMVDGWITHWWLGARFAKPADYLGFYVTWQAKITPDSAIGSEIVAGAGCDEWQGLTTGSNAGLQIARMCIVTDQWQAFDSCSVPAVIAGGNCPPLR